MIDGTTVTETLTQVGQVESGVEQPNPFAAITDNNQNGVDVADSSRGPHKNLDQRALENQMKAMIEMQKARENIANVHESQEEAGGENMVGFASTDGNQTIMNPAEFMGRISEEERKTFLTSPPEKLAEVEAVPVADLVEKNTPPLKSLIEHPVGPFAGLITKMDEQGDIPKRGERFIPTLVKSALLPFNIVKTAVKSVWEWGKKDIERLMNNLKKWNLLPKSTKQSESSPASTAASSPPPITSLNSPPLSA